MLSPNLATRWAHLCGGEGLLKVGGDSAILAIQPTKKEFEFVETNLSKQAALEKARREAQGITD